MSLVVEDGTGLTNAESYISVADATAYFTNFGGSTAWALLSNQEVALRKATRDLDVLYGASYSSSQLTTTQALLWPRSSFCDTLGRDVSGLPAAVAQAVAELAVINASTDSTGPGDNSGNLLKNWTKVGDLETRLEYFSATSASAAAVRKITLLMAPFTGGGNSLSVRVTRG